MRKLDYWLFTTEFPPEYGGGISTYCYNTVEMLKGEYNVTVFTPSNNISNNYVIENCDEFRLVKFDKTLKSNNLGSTAAISRRFYDVAADMIDRESPPDVIEIQDYLGIGYFTIHKKKELDNRFQNTKILITVHAPKFLYDEVNEAPMFMLPEYWTYYFEKYCLLNADGIIYISNYIKNMLTDRFKISATNTIIANPFEFPKVKIETDLDNELVYIGRIQKLKGSEKLLELLKENYWDKGIKLRIRMIGGDSAFLSKNTSATNHLKNKFRKYYNEGLIIFEGKITPDSIKEKTARAKAIIIPSLIDNFPSTVCEQMSFGKVLLVSHTGGQAEIIEDGKSGFVYHSSAEFKKKLDYILNLGEKDYTKYAKASQNRIVDLCGYDNVFAKKDIFIKKLLEQEQQPSYNFVFDSEIDYKPIENNVSPRRHDRKLIKNLLSIVIPCYNMEDYVEDTIISIINSKYPKKEILIVNDGSSNEGSAERLLELEKKYKEVKVLNKENGGLASARNYGFDNVSGEFTAIIDADDTIEPRFYNEAVNILKTYNNVDCVSCYVQNFEAADGIHPTWDTELPYLLYHNTLTACCVYKTESVIEYGYNDPQMLYGMEDYDSVINMTKHGRKTIVITEPYFNYRIRHDSMMRGFNYNNVAFLTERISKKHRDVYSQYVNQLVNLYNQNGSGVIVGNPSVGTAGGQIIKNTLNKNWTENTETRRYKLKVTLKKMHILDLAMAMHDAATANISLVRLTGTKMKNLCKKALRK